MKRLDREGLAASVAKTAGELRLQLAHITASSQLLERMAQGERARAYLAVVNQSICRMLRSIGRMELLHRLTDENEIRVFPRLMDLGRWTAQLAQRLQSVLQGADVTLRYQGPDILLSCADEELLRQMLLELLVQAARPGDEVSLTLKCQGESACFTVRGPGTRLDAGEWDALLKQEPGQLPEEWNIPLAQQIAQLHGGSLMVEAAADGPGTVTAVVPIRLGDDDARLESPALPRQTGGFDPAMVAFSQLLPPECLLPEELD